ncbi:TPA: hypothetical protein DEG21_05895 [Patescibacteria group bacterium]|nr:hypothetical protein [Candidatus Gracilibacteria bacterium]HBY75341.1 hypothetical protein [Candidatus Gracilibacteria bacterium]
MISQKEEKDLNLKNKITQAMIYPIAIVVVTMAMITVMMIYVIPKIEAIYRDANTNLPGLTKAVISFSHIVREK